MAHALAAKGPAIHHVFLHVTKACNLRCTYCYFSASRPQPNEMSTQDFARLWPEVVELCPAKIVFTGGEPLLRPDTLQLLRGLREADPEHRVLRCLNTNGRLVTPEVAAQLVGLADEVRVSIDALETRNDAMRGVGSFRAAMDALRVLRSVGFEPKVLVTLTSETVADLEALVFFLLEEKVSRINFNTFRPIGRGRGQEALRVNESVAQEAVQRAWHRHDPTKPPLQFAPKTEEQCHCGVGGQLNVMPDGDVFPCHTLTQTEFRLGNVRERSLVEMGRGALMCRLAALKFDRLVGEEPRLADLKKPGSCMGEVYSRTAHVPGWQRVVR